MFKSGIPTVLTVNKGAWTNMARHVANLVRLNTQSNTVVRFVRHGPLAALAFPDPSPNLETGLCVGRRGAN